MRVASVFLRKGKVFAVGEKGPGGFLIEAGPPAVADATIDGVLDALSQALTASVIPFELPPDLPPQVSGLPAAAGAKNDAAFYRGASLCTVRELDDRIEVLRGFRSGAGWHSKVLEKLPRDTSMRDLATTVLAVLKE